MFLFTALSVLGTHILVLGDILFLVRVSRIHRGG
jgi:hypothetical protein